MIKNNKLNYLAIIINLDINYNFGEKEKLRIKSFSNRKKRLEIILNRKIKLYFIFLLLRYLLFRHNKLIRR